MRKLFVPAMLVAAVATVAVGRLNWQPADAESTDAVTASQETVDRSTQADEDALTIEADKPAETEDSAEIASATKDETVTEAVSIASAEPPGSELQLPVGEQVRVVDATGWIVEGELLAAADGWLQVRTTTGREVYVSADPTAMFEVIQPGETASFVSTTATADEH